jgi:hypothetical protein
LLACVSLASSIDNSRVEAQAGLTPTSNAVDRTEGTVLGEAATTASPVQFMKFDEDSFDRPRRPGRRRTSLLALATLFVVAIAIMV